MITYIKVRLLETILKHMLRIIQKHIPDYLKVCMVDNMKEHSKEHIINNMIKYMKEYSQVNIQDSLTNNTKAHLLDSSINNMKEHSLDSFLKIMMLPIQVNSVLTMLESIVEHMQKTIQKVSKVHSIDTSKRFIQDCLVRTM